MEFDTPAGGVWDAIIVGQGLAGTTLAWQLMASGQRVLVIDGDPPVTSSRIAAGLITPITGPRMVVAENVPRALAAARPFYRAIEARTGAAFFHERRAVRLFQNAGEHATWAKRVGRPEYRDFLIPDDRLLSDEGACDTHEGGFAFAGAQLDVAGYLDASRARFAFECRQIDWSRDVIPGADNVAVCGHRARLVVACEGYVGAHNRFFSWVPFNPAKGDILTVRFDRHVARDCIHRGIWIAPAPQMGLHAIGSTYHWDTLDTVPSAAGRADIEHRLAAFWRTPYTVIDHKAAVRPVISRSKPKMGWHPQLPRLAFFNGLGSKGSLLAPWFAHAFVRAIVEGAPLPDGSDVRAYWP